jgi:hypothetical protein
MKLFISLLFIVILAGCKTEKNEDSDRNESTESADNRGSSSNKNKDNFYAFFYKFLSDENYRSERIKNEDLMNKIFLPESDFTIHIYPFDSIDFREFEEDLSSKKIYSVISASKNEITNYNFIKEDNKWLLASIDAQKFDISDDKKFIPFLLKFSKDTVYQKKHTRFPLESSFLDYDNDYADTTVYLSQNEVHAKNFLVNNYLPFLHNGEILKEEYINSTVYFWGNGNGIYIECLFKFINGEWFLVEEKDFST